MRAGRRAVAAAVAMTAAAAPAAAPDGGDERAAFLASLHPASGDVRIPAAHATLHLAKAYYYLDAADAKRVLTEAWGNPADGVSDVLGMVVPAGKTVLDETWGAVVTYEDSGHVPETDASKEDFDAVLAAMRDGEEARNAERRKAGFATQHLVGWAQAPAYDAATHSMVWARDLRFGDAKVDTLNYDVRLLGRAGVLSLNMVSTMPQLAETRAAAAAFGRTAAFDAGSRYADYDKGTDRLADYGLAGLVAAGVGAVAVKKLGLLAVVLLFAKKFAVLIVAAVATLGARFRKLLGRGTAGDG